MDTGGWHTNCSDKFVRANAGELDISFGNHRALATECLDDDAVLYRPAEYGFPQVYMRMNDLLRFSAFGWELNPLRVYFVPREGRNAPARS